MTTTERVEAQIQHYPKGRWVIPALAVTLCLAIALSCAVGALQIPLADFLPALFGRGTSAASQLQHEVLWQIRLPRVALAILIGGALVVRLIIE